LYNILALGDPQGHFGIAPTKQLKGLVFAGNEQQARTNQFADLVTMATHAECFEGYLDPRTTNSSSLGLFTPHQLAQGAPERPGLVLESKQSTALGGRGPSSFMQHFDEFAHSTGAGSTSTSQEIWQAATPSLAQCGPWAFIYEGSSPWAQDGQFFENYQRGLQVDPITHEPANPDILVIQLPSWAPYVDADRGAEIEMWPEGPFFEPAAPIIECGAALARVEASDPDGFAVEYRAHWRTHHDAYLRKDQVAAIFAPWQGQTLETREHGVLSCRYVAHADPSRSGANFGLAVGHAETVDGLTHVVGARRVRQPPDRLPLHRRATQVAARPLQPCAAELRPVLLSINNRSTPSLCRTIQPPDTHRGHRTASEQDSQRLDGRDLQDRRRHGPHPCARACTRSPRTRIPPRTQRQDRSTDNRPSAYR
jgi:hypothetical protein